MSRAVLVIIVSEAVPPIWKDRFGLYVILAILAAFGWMGMTYLMRTSEAPLLKKVPSEYMRDMYYTSQPLETDHMKATEGVESEEPGWVRFQVLPPDAAVYLDGRFLGNGHELARLHDDLVVAPGRHALEVVRPGYEAERREFTLEPGEVRVVDVKLQGS